MRDFCFEKLGTKTMSSFGFCGRQLMSFVNHNYCHTQSDECSNVLFFCFWKLWEMCRIEL